MAERSIVRTISGKGDTLALTNDHVALEFRAYSDESYVIVETTMEQSWVGTTRGNAATAIEADEAIAIVAFLIQRFNLPPWTLSVGDRLT